MTIDISKETEQLHAYCRKYISPDMPEWMEFRNFECWLYDPYGEFDTTWLSILVLCEWAAEHAQYNPNGDEVEALIGCPWDGHKMPNISRLINMAHQRV